ncbi:MrcB family domain-containing protein [Rossellomorea sp. GCM10028870]|uniref:MrcB family domain-containing protein n=1 Tax=Rossellomorea sp. GCM10028870 TaxID=3273426 RepID=UPI00361FEE49
MLLEIIKALSKQTKMVETLSLKKTNYIRKVDENGIFVETESSLEKFQRGEKTTSMESISFVFLKQAWEEFSSKRVATKEDFVKTKGRTSFIMSFFARLPFVKVVEKGQKTAISFIEFKTDDLPNEQIHKVMTFLEEIIEGTYQPERLSEQLEGNEYRIKSRARQDLRLLGFLDKNQYQNEELFKEYIQSSKKIELLREQISHKEYFRIAIEILDLLKDHNPIEKKRALIEIGKLIVRNSLGDNLMVDSVAKERTTNLLKWLQHVDLIDDEYTPNIQINTPKEHPVVKTSIREKLLYIMNNYVQAKAQPFGGNELGSYVRNDVPKEFKQLECLNEQYVVTGSVGQGNWASVPWVAIMNKAITTSTQRGYYIVYLFSEDMSRLYLTLAQGVTETTREEMLKRKKEIRDHVEMKASVKKDDDLYLGESSKAKGYALSTAAYIKYRKDDMPSEGELVDDLESMIAYYERYIEYSTTQDETDDVLPEVEEIQVEFQSDGALIDHIHNYISAKGYYYDRKDIINLYLSLKTKPFVILSGISGTGKTKIVQLLAESLGATAENGQFALIPVRPDWSDGSDLIGYRDIKGEFQAGPLTKVLMEANQPENRDKPYFLLLDEMNLARVEYYFSDLLSVMESRDCQNGEMVSAPVVEEEEVGRLLLRDNFYIIGTVNMDETTHPFSPKVLDRANTIEYNDVVLDHFGFLTMDSIAEPVAIDNQQMAGRFLNLKDAFINHEDLVRKVTGLLVEVNTILEPIKAHFGYRVRDEVCFYMIYNDEGQLMKFDDAFNFQLVQKVLPRLTGNDLKTEEVLKKLFLFCTSHEWDEMNAASIVEEARFSKSAEKLSNMIPKIMHDGFTSFWGS